MKWMDIAKREIGITEIPGKGNADRILGYHSTTSLHATEDSVPWCSSFVNWVVTRSGLDGTNSARARSWLGWGREIDIPAYGCIVVLWRKSKYSSKGHVGFFVGFNEDKTRVFLLGGNQSDKVKVSSYPSSRILSYRLPWSLDNEKIITDPDDDVELFNPED